MADFSALKTAIQTYIKQNGNEEITGEILQEILLSVVTTLGDSAINDLVTALANEVAARQNADGTLQGNINSEATARANGDTALSNRLGSTITAENTAAEQIGAEAEAREAADTALQGLIDGITDNIENGYVYAGIATPSTTPVTGKVFYLALQGGQYTHFGNTAVMQGINIFKYNGSSWLHDAYIGISDKPMPSDTGLVKAGGTFDFVMDNGSAFDISKYFASGSTLATYENLSVALADLDGLDAAYKRGGMSIRFVQSSDNKYVQYRLMSDTFSTTETDWQGVDEEIKYGSKNLAESGAVKHSLFNLANDTKLPFVGLTKDDIIAKVGTYVKYEDGRTGTTSDTFATSDYINIEGALTIQYSRMKRNPGNIYFGMAFYSDSNVSSYISGQPIILDESEDGYVSTKLAVPRNAKYARFTMYVDEDTYGAFILKLYGCDNVYDVSRAFPTSGTSGTNKYSISTAIAQIPTEKQVGGINIRFINSNDKYEQWRLSKNGWSSNVKDWVCENPIRYAYAENLKIESNKCSWDSLIVYDDTYTGQSISSPYSLTVETSICFVILRNGTIQTVTTSNDIISSDVILLHYNSASGWLGGLLSDEYIKIGTKELDSLRKQILYVSGLNYNYNADRVSKYIRYDNGGLYSTSNTFSATNYINIEGLDCIYYTRLKRQPGNPYFGMAFYSENDPDSFISGQQILLNDVDKDGYTVQKIAVPAGAKYARFTTYTDIDTYGVFIVSVSDFSYRYENEDLIYIPTEFTQTPAKAIDATTGNLRDSVNYSATDYIELPQ